MVVVYRLLFDFDLVEISFVYWFSDIVLLLFMFVVFVLLNLRLLC